jgi:hypothetical protein
MLLLHSFGGGLYFGWSSLASGKRNNNNLSLNASPEENKARISPGLID